MTPQENTFYVIFKLVSGENVMGVLTDEDEHHVRIDEPIHIRTTPVFNTGKETITATPLCQFSKNNSVILDKKHLMFMHPLHHAFIPHYTRIVNQSQGNEFIPADSEEDTDDPLDNIFFVNGTDTLN